MGELRNRREAVMNDEQPGDKVPADSATGTIVARAMLKVPTRTVVILTRWPNNKARRGQPLSIESTRGS